MKMIEWLGVVIIAAFIASFTISSDNRAMKVCQLSHSFETCHHTIYR